MSAKSHGHLNVKNRICSTARADEFPNNRYAIEKKKKKTAVNQRIGREKSLLEPYDTCINGTRPGPISKHFQVRLSQLLNSTILV